MTSRGLATSTWKYQRAKQKTTLISSSSQSTASTSIPSRELTRARATGSDLSLPPHAADHIGALVAEEDRAQHVERLDLRRAERLDNPLLDPLRRQGRIPFEVAEGDVEPGVRQQVPHHGGRPPGGRHTCGRSPSPSPGRGSGSSLGRVVDGRIDAAVGEDPAGQGVEVGLGDLEVVTPEDGLGVSLLEGHPDLAVGKALPEVAPEDLDRPVDAPRRQVQFLNRGLPDAVPVALLEPFPHLAGNLAQALVVLVERPMDRLGALGRHVRRDWGKVHGGIVSEICRRGRARASSRA